MHNAVQSQYVWDMPSTYLDDQEKYVIARIAITKYEVKVLKCNLLFTCADEGDGSCDVTYRRRFDMEGLNIDSGEFGIRYRS